jgi:hypothetical protein
MEKMLISLQLMGPSYKPIHACLYIVPRSVGQQFQKFEEIVRLVDIGGSLKKCIPMNGLLHSQHLQFLRKTYEQDNDSCYQFQEAQLIVKT